MTKNKNVLRNMWERTNLELKQLEKHPKHEMNTFWMNQHTKHVCVYNINLCTIWNHSRPPKQGKSHQGVCQQFQHSVYGSSQHEGVPFRHFQIHHTQVSSQQVGTCFRNLKIHPTQVKYIRKPTTGPQTCLTAKI